MPKSIMHQISSECVAVDSLYSNKDLAEEPLLCVSGKYDWELCENTSVLVASLNTMQKSSRHWAEDSVLENKMWLLTLT